MRASILGPHDHGKRRRNSAIQPSPTRDAIRFAASRSSRFSPALKGLCVPGSRATGSRRNDEQTVDLRNFLSMFYAIGKRAQGERLDPAAGFRTRRSIGHNAGQCLDLGDPAAIFFPFEVDSKHFIASRSDLPTHD
jgi:hypothetical protein